MKNKKKFYLALVIFSLVGQVAWVVENMYLNVFIYKMFHASAQQISLMVAASAITATVTTFGPWCAAFACASIGLTRWCGLPPI